MSLSVCFNPKLVFHRLPPIQKIAEFVTRIFDGLCFNKFQYYCVNSLLFVQKQFVSSEMLISKCQKVPLTSAPVSAPNAQYSLSTVQELWGDVRPLKQQTSYSFHVFIYIRSEKQRSMVLDITEAEFTTDNADFQKQKRALHATFSVVFLLNCFLAG